MTTSFADFINGAIAMGHVVAALFFLRFWHATRDRLFLYFASAFGLMAVQRTILTALRASSELEVPSYGLRLLAFLLILAAVLDKNLRRL
jgi:hypothetical protein